MSFLKKIIQDIYIYLYNNSEISIDSKLFDYGKVTYNGKTLILKTPTLSEYINVRRSETLWERWSLRYGKSDGSYPTIYSPSEVKKNILKLTIFNKVYKEKNGYYLIPSRSEAKKDIIISLNGHIHNPGNIYYIISLPIIKIDYKSYLDYIPAEVLSYAIAPIGYILYH